jgi:hypothetical protein
MYGLTDRLSLMTMGSFVSNKMEMIDRMNSDKTKTQHISGFGDTTINSSYAFVKTSDSRVLLNLGLSIPTGGIKKNGADGSRAAYMMQTGSGSYEFHPGLSYSGFQDSFSYGAQLNGQFRLNSNNSGYKFGDVYNATSWIGKKLNEAFSLSSRLNYTITEKVEGIDPAIVTRHTSMSMTMPMSPTSEASFTGGQRLDFLLGANFVVPSGSLKGHRLAVEGGTPLFQKVNGIQMKNRYNFTIGWQKAF